MTSPPATLLLIVLATAAAFAAVSAAPSAASSVEFSEKSVSEHDDANGKCDIRIDGNCRDVKCCRDLCQKRIRYGYNMLVGRPINGGHRCLCSVTYKGKPGSCAP